MPLTEEEISTIGQAVIAEVTHQLSISQTRQAVARAGFDAAQIPGEDRRASIVPALLRQFGQMPLNQKTIAVHVLARRLQPDASDALLNPFGFKFVDGHFLPLGTSDAREARFMPPSSAEQIATAFDRLSAGDEDGAIAAACGAVDTATIAIYEKRNMGKPPDSFQAKVNTVMDVLKVYEEMEAHLIELNVKPADAKEITSELHEATKHAANALQVIRRALGDVHGSKPAYTHLTYDAIKWASAICGLLEGKI